VSDDFTSISSLLGNLMGDGGLRRAMGKNQRAAIAWRAANGDIEREHTTGVFVKDARMPGRPPVLGVYVDSRMRAVDFRANREVYLARLSMAGYEFSDIEFLVTKYGKKKPTEKKKESAAQEELPQLSASEEQECRDMVSGLSEPLRDKVYKALCLSKRRVKIQHTTK
jgi:hypothetical protein